MRQSEAYQAPRPPELKNTARTCGRREEPGRPGGEETSESFEWAEADGDAGLRTSLRLHLRLFVGGIAVAVDRDAVQGLFERQPAGVRLVVPQPYRETYPASLQRRIITFADFIEEVLEFQKNLPDADRRPR